MLDIRYLDIECKVAFSSLTRTVAELLRCGSNIGLAILVVYARNKCGILSLSLQSRHIERTHTCVEELQSDLIARQALALESLKLGVQGVLEELLIRPAILAISSGVGVILINSEVDKVPALLVIRGGNCQCRSCKVNIRLKLKCAR